MSSFLFPASVLRLLHHDGEVVRSVAEQGHRALPDGTLRQEDVRQQRVPAHGPGAPRQSGKGPGCSAAVEQSPLDCEVKGSIPAGRWAFFILSTLFLVFLFWLFLYNKITECP